MTQAEPRKGAVLRPVAGVGVGLRPMAGTERAKPETAAKMEGTEHVPGPMTTTRPSATMNGMYGPCRKTGSSDHLGEKEGDNDLAQPGPTYLPLTLVCCATPHITLRCPQGALSAHPAGLLCHWQETKLFIRSTAREGQSGGPHKGLHKVRAHYIPKMSAGTMLGSQWREDSVCRPPPQHLVPPQSL